MERDYIKKILQFYDMIQKIKEDKEELSGELKRHYAEIMLIYLKYTVQYCKDVLSGKQEEIEEE